MTDQPRPEPEAGPGPTRPADPAELLWQRWRQGQAPDVDDFLRQAGPLTPAQLVTVLRVDQRHRWLRGQRVPAEDYLRRQPALAADAEAALDLIFSEFVLREELGDTPRPEDYLERFPRYGAPLERLLRLDRALLADTPADGAPAAVPCPHAVGRYRIISLLGEGGQALVYRAVHPTLGMDVVLKWSRRPLPEDPAERDRLLAEGRILAGLEQPNLARVYDLDLHEGRPFLVMEYVRGRTLAQAAAQASPSPAQAAAVVARVARALAAAHQRGVLHLDVKPKNILIGDDGQPRLLDFGLARLQDAYADEREGAGQVSGTVQYMAPEQARGEVQRVGPRSDVFGLGGVLYFLLTGRAPFTGADFAEALERARRCAWDRAALRTAAVPPRLAAVCARTLAADPEDRYPGAAELADDLETFVRRPRRRALLAVGAALLVLALLSLWPWRQSLWFSGGQGDLPGAPDPRTTAGDRGAGSAPRVAPALAVRVWDGDRYRNLIDLVPLRTGEDVQVAALVPADLHASLFLINGEGKIEHLADLPADAADRMLRYPPQEGQSAPLTGPAGTECLLLCGRRSGPVSVEKVQELWGDGPWPALPGLALLRLERGQVRLEQRGRDLGPPHERPDPESAVRSRLEALRLRLTEHCDFFEGLAFAHQP
jgi:tRNA A-37 threonylcarbamoyl transferase component Bud32